MKGCNLKWAHRQQLRFLLFAPGTRLEGQSTACAVISCFGVRPLELRLPQPSTAPATAGMPTALLLELSQVAWQGPVAAGAAEAPPPLSPHQHTPSTRPTTRAPPDAHCPW